MPEECRRMIMSEDYYDFILYEMQLRIGTVSNVEEGYCIQNLEYNFYNMYVSSQGLPPLNFENYTYSNIPNLYGLVQDMSDVLQAEDANAVTPRDVTDPESLLDYESLSSSGILDLQASQLSLKGRGVLIGYLDTGIDYPNPVFRYSDGSSRIAAIWDQTIQTGNKPELFDYGSEYMREDINRALRSENPYEIVPSRDENGHGSAMAGVQAAPEATIAMVKLKPAKQYLRDFYCVREGAVAYAETDLLTALKYLDDLADRLDMPLVIVVGLGTNLGDHSGSSILAGYCEYLLENTGRAIVVAGGNEGNARHHYFGEMSGFQNESGGAGPPGVTQEVEYRSVEIRVGDNEEQFMLELWGGRPDIYSVSVRSPGGETVPRIQARRSLSVQYSFLYEATVINVDYVIAETRTGAELIMIRFHNPTPGIWTIGVYAEGSEMTFPLAGNVIQTFHIWLPINTFISDETYFLLPNPDVTLTGPANGAGPLTVSTYQASNDSFYVRSGRGFTRMGRIKPDLASPGVNVLTVGGRRSASCMAAAIAGGALAQYLEWAVVQGNAPYFRMNDMKYYLYRGAERSNLLTYPNNLWGYGRLNIKGAFDAMRALLI